MMKTDEMRRLLPAFQAMEAVVQSDIDQGFPSCQIAIRRSGKRIYHQAWGVLNTAKPNGPDNQAGTKTLYDLASNTKMYTVNYALQYLHSQGVLNLDLSVSQILGPSFYDSILPISYEGMDPFHLQKNRAWKQNLTIRHLLTHRGGFPADPRYFMRPFDFSRQVLDPKAVNPLYLSLQGKSLDQIRQETLRAIGQTPLMYEPGTRTLYSDVDYMLLGFLVEKITGMNLEDYLKQTFWDPMGLSSVCFNPWKKAGSWPEGIAATELHGNTRDGAVFFEGVRTQTLQGQVHDEKAWYLMGGVSGHAGLFANADDLSILASLMLEGQWNGKTYFLPDTLRVFCSPVLPELDHWGLGWWRQGKEKKRKYYFSADAGPRTIGHQGWTGTLTLIDPEEDLVMVILTNKINTPVTCPLSDPNTFDGEDFVTSTLGFAPRLFYAALKSPDPENAADAVLSVLDALVRERDENQAGTDSDSARRACQAIRSAREHCQKILKR